ncbi:hypothetical protein [Kineococcus sp. R86509]|uniref:hypothetical protein n=1 Tax=Kineococcus sp. R86509 TaxID=3093851 RepID=UPI0036D20B8D
MAQEPAAHERSLQKIFSSGCAFSVPVHRRPYRWGRDEAVRLLDDLEQSAPSEVRPARPSSRSRRRSWNANSIDAWEVR